MKKLENSETVSSSKIWVLPDADLSHDDIISGIRLAEDGPFHTVHESMDHF
jgi:hypothetical protein